MELRPDVSKRWGHIDPFAMSPKKRGAASSTETNAELLQTNHYVPTAPENSGRKARQPDINYLNYT